MDESSLFLALVHSPKQHLALVIDINTNSSFLNDVMSRQGLIDRRVRAQTCLRGRVRHHY